MPFIVQCFTASLSQSLWVYKIDHWCQMEHLLITVKLLVKFVTRNKYYEQTRILNHPTQSLKKASFMFDVPFSFQGAERLLAPDPQQGRIRSVPSRRQQTPQCPALELHTGRLGSLAAPAGRAMRLILGNQLPQCPLVMWKPELCADCWRPGWKQAALCLPPHGQALMRAKNQHIITGERTGSLNWVRIASLMNKQVFYICKGDSWKYSVVQQMGSCSFFFREKI